ncbi:uncharacterized protein LOC121259039 isoform X2 [Juglans microcarpa x Juglans regia]|uniref:uncharacterized protein LOC121259039 isoform X2 n=1 Tax=Juglans microcarpa x Juglans regia TaxID=2249226 RepID=UPI001B7E29AC|nr:uncharacterized protein LOC121259039 isoform X2 [Juglans microcarpa x Juglans regia]
MVLVVAGINSVKTDAENTKVRKARLGTDELFPANYSTCIEFVKLANKALLTFLGLGFTAITKIESNKKKHTWAVQILNELLELHSTYEDAASTSGDHARESAQSRTKESEETMPYGLLPDQLISSETPPTDSMKTTGSTNGMEKTLKTAKTIILIDSKNGVNDIVKKVQELLPISIQDRNAESKNLMMIVDQDKPAPEMPKKETPILLAAKNGIVEIVKRILEVCPIAINDVNADSKNIVLLAVEYRQPKVLYELFLRRNNLKETMFRQLDNEENSALHLAAKLGDKQPWRIPGAALQMQWENKWYEDQLKFAAIPVYAVTCLPVTFFAMAQFPLYIDLLRATVSKVPQRSHKVDP